MISPPILPLLALACAVTYLYKRWRARISLRDIQGPKSYSFLLGNLGEMYLGPAAEADFKWHQTFGSVVRYKGILNDDYLMISDPKALQHILHTSAYHFVKDSGGKRALTHLLAGRSLNSVDGEEHRRQRKVMLPAFGGPESRALFPVFTKISQELVARWKDTISQEASADSGSVIFNIPKWLSRATLDAIGEAAFDYQFGALDNAETELGKAYEHVNGAFFGIPTPSRVFVDSLIDYLPSWLVLKLVTSIPNERPMRYTADTSARVAKDLLREKRGAVDLGKSSRDVMSQLVKANASTNPKAQLSEEELYAEMRIILFAGHETTSNTLTWTLWELAKHPEVQTRLRTEIKEAQVKAQAKGQTELALHDIEGIEYLQAVLKEGLRFHPAVPRFQRVARDDEVIPLSKPIRATSGATLSELMVPGGTKIVVTIAAYNRYRELWGPDANVFNPDRWMSSHERNKEHTSIGVVGNTLTFSSGTRSCIGWRFAMTEMQCFLVDLISNFEFSLPPDGKRIRREAPALMFPVVEGETQDGVKLPLCVSIATGQ
ncbi:cytochrome P450 [Heliocybe sulcata]|uniref:Cytochrome P450 n=1 Tax=Heliocybe sulcata TaxID=5364 RepID=A0A5C3MXN8_9AGAM|nr:cytochrome P450 [Heliocybe sulcata]